MYKTTLLILFASTLTAGCGSSNGPSSGTGPLTLRVTDTPIDTAAIDRVCVDFARITVHYASEQDTVLDHDPLPSQVSAQTHCVDGTWDGTPPTPPVRLDALGGPLTVALVESFQIPVGRVTWIRLHFADGSFVTDNVGAQHDLRCPSCEATDDNDGRGFKLNRTFEVTNSGLALTVDIDLRKSLHEDANGYVLRPTARIEVDSTLGTIAGDVEETVVTDAGGTPYAGTDVDTGCAVYVYAGHDATPDDYHTASPVVSTARVFYDVTSGVYRYAAGALPGGTEAAPEPYTVALTCDLDDPLVDDSDADVTFTAGQDADVVAGQTATADFS